MMNQVDERDMEAMAGVWNEACGEDWAISARFVAYNLRPSAGVDRRVWLTRRADGQAAGFVIASRLQGEPEVAPETLGWINAVAVAPAEQGRGIGRRLLAEAEDWLRGLGCEQVRLGGSVRPFTPGLPVDPQPATGSLEAFVHLGYQPEMDDDPLDQIWDVGADLALYEPPEMREVAGAVHPAAPGQEGLLLDFLKREFPGRWRYDAEEFLDDGGRISDFMLLWTATGVEGFCQLTFDDSVHLMERYYPYDLPKPWGQLGPLGVSEGVRGQGFGLAVVDAGLRRLHNNGVNGCVIDWTSHLDFYAKFGFQPRRAYQKLVKRLG
jgi:predicted N-acetyltransferase YhbS